MGGTTAEKFIGQMIDKVADSSNVQGSVEAWNGGYSDKNQSQCHRVHTSPTTRSPGLKSAYSVSGRQLATRVMARPGDDLRGWEDVRYV